MYLIKSLDNTLWIITIFFIFGYNVIYTYDSHYIVLIQ